MYEQLKKAIESGNFDEVKRLASEVSDIDSTLPDTPGDSSLLLACKKYISSYAAGDNQQNIYAQIIKYLLDKGADNFFQNNEQLTPMVLIGEDTKFSNYFSTTTTTTQLHTASSFFSSSTITSAGSTAAAAAAATTTNTTPTTSGHSSPASSSSPRAISTSSDSAVTTASAVRATTSEVNFIIPTLLSNTGEISASFNVVMIDSTIRPPTNLPAGAQGDHTTAYCVVLQMLFDCIDGEPLNEIPTILAEMAKCFLNQNDYDDIDAIKKTFSQSLQENVIERSERKQLTKFLRNKSDTSTAAGSGGAASSTSTPSILSKTGIEKIKNAIKQHEQSLLLSGVCLMGKTIIEKHQRDPLAVMSKVRGSQVDERNGAEGSRVKDALLNLKLLNQLIRFKQQLSTTSATDEVESLLTNYRNNAEYTIKVARPSIQNPKTYAENYNKFISQLRLNTLKITFFSSDSKPLQSIDQSWLNKIRKCDFLALSLDCIGDFINDTFDYRYVAAETAVDIVDEEENRDKLCKIARKHIICVFMAFSALNSVHQTLKSSLVEYFATKIVTPVNNGGQGWHASKIGQNNLTVSALKDDICKGLVFEETQCRLRSDDDSTAATTTTSATLGNI